MAACKPIQSEFRENSGQGKLPSAELEGINSCVSMSEAGAVSRRRLRTSRKQHANVTVLPNKPGICKKEKMEVEGSDLAALLGQ